jgi:D-alanine-D-alanine ligase
MCLHKHHCKQILRTHDLATPAARLVRAIGELDTDPDLSYPLFCKLDYEDASVGVEASNVVHDFAQLRARVGQMIPEFNQPVLIERYIAGREVNAAVFGSGDEARVLPLHEIDFSAMPAGRPHIVTYAGKWDEHHIDYAGTKPVQMQVDPQLQAAIEKTALATYRALGLRDFGRVDLRIDAAGRPWVIDVNPNCDLSRDAGYARAARVAGMEYAELVGRICEMAWRRHADDGTRPRLD